MIRSIHKIPRKCIVAFSGGVDSVAVTDFLMNGRRDVEIAFFHHGTNASCEGSQFARKFARDRGIIIHERKISRERRKDESQEEFWRIERYQFLESLSAPIITGHHLDDAVESWIFSSLHGEGRLIPPQRGIIMRPFLITPKSEFISWCKVKGLSWIEDESNNDTKYMRNLIRHDIVPHALRVNPGLPKVIKKKYLALYKSQK